MFSVHGIFLYNIIIYVTHPGVVSDDCVTIINLHKNSDLLTNIHQYRLPLVNEILDCLSLNLMSVLKQETRFVMTQFLCDLFICLLRPKSINIWIGISKQFVMSILSPYSLKGSWPNFGPDLIHFVFYSLCYKQASLEQSNSTVWGNIMQRF